MYTFARLHLGFDFLLARVEFVLLYSRVLTYWSVDQTMQCDYFLESYRRILSCSAVCFVIQCGLNFLLCGSNHLM